MTFDSRGERTVPAQLLARLDGALRVHEHSWRLEAVLERQHRPTADVGPPVIMVHEAGETRLRMVTGVDEHQLVGRLDADCIIRDARRVAPVVLSLAEQLAIIVEEVRIGRDGVDGE